MVVEAAAAVGEVVAAVRWCSCAGGVQQGESLVTLMLLPLLSDRATFCMLYASQPVQLYTYECLDAVFFTSFAEV